MEMGTVERSPTGADAQSSCADPDVSTKGGPVIISMESGPRGGSFFVECRGMYRRGMCRRGIYRRGMYRRGGKEYENPLTPLDL